MNGHRKCPFFFRMVKKSVLAKLSDRELEKYLEKGNRFVPEAVQIAVQILEERGRIFADVEKADIQNIIQNKIDSEEQKLKDEQEDLKDHITENPSAIALHSRTLIWTSSLLLGTSFGAILMASNFIMLKKYTSGFLTLILGVIYFPFQYYAYQFIIENNFANHGRYSPEIFPIVLGPAILTLIWVTAMPKRLPYRSKSLLIPAILAIPIFILIINNYKDLFSSYFIVDILNLQKQNFQLFLH